MNIPKTQNCDWTSVKRYSKIPIYKLWFLAALIPAVAESLVPAATDWTTPAVEPGSRDATACLARDGGAGLGAAA